MTSGRKKNYWNSQEANKVYWTWLSNQDKDPTFDEAAENLDGFDDPPVALWRALAGLTDKQKFVLGLRFGYSGHGEYNLEEIAGLMGVSHVAVIRILRRALDSLHRGLQNEG